MKKDKDFATIFKGSREATGVMRGRDVRARLQHKDIDPELRSIIETIAEINHTNVLAVAELATMLDQVIDNLQGFSDIAENMKKRTDQLLRSTQAETEGDAGAQDTGN